MSDGSHLDKVVSQATSQFVENPLAVLFEGRFLFEMAGQSCLKAGSVFERARFQAAP
jgi:hypothetical protein